MYLVYMMVIGKRYRRYGRGVTNRNRLVIYTEIDFYMHEVLSYVSSVILSYICCHNVLIDSKMAFKLNEQGTYIEYS